MPSRIIRSRIKCRQPPWERHTNEQQTENDDKLVDAVAQDVLGHGAGDEWLIATVWFSHEQ